MWASVSISLRCIAPLLHLFLIWHWQVFNFWGLHNESADIYLMGWTLAQDKVCETLISSPPAHVLGVDLFDEWLSLRGSGKLWDGAGHMRLKSPLDPSQGPVHLVLSQHKELKGPGPCATSRQLWSILEAPKVPVGSSGSLLAMQYHTLHHSTDVDPDKHHTHTHCLFRGASGRIWPTVVPVCHF